MGCPAPNDARFARMRVYDVRTDLPEQSNEPPISAKVLERQNRSLHFIDDDHAVPVTLRPLKQRPFRTDGWSGDQRHLMAAIVLTFTGEQRVFLRTAENQTSDDVNDSHATGSVY
jgi:hypothetical protein